MSTGGKTGGGGGGSPGDTIASEATSLANPITFYKDKTTFYPSNGQIWWSMKRPPELGTDAPPKIYLEVFDPSLRYQVGLGNSSAPKGHFVLDAFHQDRSAVSGVDGLDVHSAGGKRPSAVSFYAGRVWYAGVNADGFNTSVYFSQILERDDQIQYCYQEADPTSEEIRDLLPNDGGVVKIPEAALVHHMVAYGAWLFIFASNGVWMISGSDAGGFRATDFQVSKLSGVPTISNMSFVLVDGIPMWWNRTGIYSVILSEQGQPSIQSITDRTIKTFFRNIPDESKVYVKGAWDPITARVQWLYSSVAPQSIGDRYKYDSILTFDTRTGAFSPWSPRQYNRVDIRGIFDLVGAIQEQSIEDVTDTLDGGVTVGGEVVTVSVTTAKLVDSKIKYIVNVKSDSDV